MAIQDDKLSIASLTGGEKEGSGAFDELMRSVKSHLVSEHSAGRITGDNYTQAYISSLDMALGNASQYLLAYELTNQQIRLADEQIAKAKLEVILTQSQIDLAEEQIIFLGKQTLKLESDTELVDAQVLVQSKQLLVMDTQIDKLVSETLMVEQQTANALTQNSQIVSTTAKIDAEQVVLTQRALSEEAQTKDTLAGQPVQGILGKQMELYQNQADGYIRDAEQKAAKLMNDTFITRVSTDWDNPDASVAGLNDDEVAKVVSKLKTGIGVL
jgi:hypothetical protein